MDPIERKRFSLPAMDGDRDDHGRLPAFASVEVEVDLLRKNERTPAHDEFTDEEAEAFGYC